MMIGVFKSGILNIGEWICATEFILRKAFHRHLEYSGGGNTEVKIIEDFYFNETDNAYELRRKCQNGNDFCVQGKRYSKYDTVSDTITNSHSGNVIEPLICASRGRNPENPSNRTVGMGLEQRIEVNEGGTSNTLTSVNKDNYVIEPTVLTPKRNENGDVSESRHNMTELQPKAEPTSNTLTSVQNDNYLIEPKVDVMCRAVPVSGKLHQNQEVYNSNGLCGTLKSSHFKGPPKTMFKYRIRKLTPKECIRLMNFDDSDYDKIKAIGMSDSQIYKQCGNSIIVACLDGIFRKMYIDTEVSNEQLSFF